MNTPTRFSSPQEIMKIREKRINEFKDRTNNEIKPFIIRQIHEQMCRNENTFEYKFNNDNLGKLEIMKQLFNGIADDLRSVGWAVGLFIDCDRNNTNYGTYTIHIIWNDGTECFMDNIGYKPML